MPDTETITLDPISRLSKDLRESAALLSPTEVRYLVDLYYTVQKYRIRGGNQVLALSKSVEPHALIHWSSELFDRFESNVRSAMLPFVRSQRPGRWLLSVHGIGQVIAAGLLAHIDIKRAPTAGHIWRFAGLDPTVKWKRKKKRPWNAKLKVVCWKAGQSFMKTRASDNAFYGRIYEERKALEVERNEAGSFADQAAATLKEKNIEKKETRAYYEAGKLPPGRIELRAERYAVKLFLSHLHHVLYVCEFGTDPPVPYIMTKAGHAHYIPVPGWPVD